ncbi:MAG: histidine kinase [Chitinophagales bacterium]|nr:histidine kinase [Chitinophagales bacterium]
MKKLYVQIAEAEAKLATANNNEKLWLWFELSKLYMNTDAAKSTAYENLILATEHITDTEIYLRACLLRASSYMNNFELDAALEIVATVVEQNKTHQSAYVQHEALVLFAYTTHLKDSTQNVAPYFEQAIALHEQLSDHDAKALCYCLYGSYNDELDPSESYKRFLVALEWARNGSHPGVLGYVLYLLGEWCVFNSTPNDALVFLLEAHALLEDNRATLFLGHTSRRLRATYMKLGNFPLAKKYQLQALECLEAAGNNREKALGCSQTADFLMQHGEFEPARQYLDKCLAYLQMDAATERNGFYFNSLGDLEKFSGNYTTAITLFEKAKEGYGAGLPPTTETQIDLKMSECYEALNDHVNAFRYLKKYTTTKLKYIDEERSKELAQLQGKYEAEKRETELRELKIKQQQTELERSESELKAIKAQMNPHFIFNALNSIQEMFFIGDKRLANEHLGKFSQLTRDILKASGKQFITLAEETEMLTKYLELEGLRFEKDFSFRISVNDEDAADDILLPPMLIQPYVENAIRHGLLHQAGEKKIAVRFHFDEEKSLLACAVEDNGIGRAASAKINAHRNPLHESFSTSANAKRLELLNQNREEKIGVQYEDLQQGTRVLLTIPIRF